MVCRVRADAHEGGFTASAITADGGVIPADVPPIAFPDGFDKFLTGLVSRLNFVLMVATIPGSSQQVHRGRIQAQGGGLESSVPWNQTTPPTAAQGLKMLNALKTQLSPKDLRARAAVFTKAERFIQNAGNAGGVSAPVSKTFLVPGTRDIRVDIEVITGHAFVP